ncbi:ABC transporter ATP-binding protein [Halocatena pleomorpha]|uniref:ABC-type D-xylose/L-arabinose transporter n=1 Tax=Halocatena pleomorpha TaxID=1785090 RepID=A0A3P3R2J0_9EURY|nr:ABC transporter ATP-binding protein [Halocatena pleomorpha]RRJ27677.1 ABC transporter ATP-binding protein [Halocatena pleomorpha]
MARLTLDHVTKRYGDVVAVDDLSLDITDGEFITLVGPSGCGKSTTIEIVAGLTDATEGSVHIGDRNVTTLPPKDRGVAMVFQNIALFPHMSVFKNVSFGLRLRDYETAEIERRVDRAMEIVQLGGMGDRKPEELSGGQRQRVAIARAIVRNPDVFLMDEPLANLDATLRTHMRTELQRLHKQLDTTVMYVTHDQAEAMTMSDRIAVINDGTIQQFAPPLTCYNEPRNLFVAGFIGSPGMNLFDGTATADGFNSAAVSVSFDHSSDIPHKITLGVRPEDAYLAGSNRAERLSAPSTAINAVVDVIEPMGDEMLVYLLCSDEAAADAESVQLLVSVPPETDVEVDESVQVVFDRSRVHLFETASGAAITHGLDTEITPDTDRP